MEPQFLNLAVRAADVPPEGVEGRLTADAGQRAAIADALDLVSLDALTFDYRVRRSGRGRLKLDGRLEASVVQSCVITLEPLENMVSEEVSLDFWPPEEIAGLEQTAAPAEFEIGLEGPEPLEDGTLDIGQLAYETLASSLDPYPRKPGAVFEEESRPRDAHEVEDSPFAALRSLKTGNK